MSDDLISRKEALELIRDIAYNRNLSTIECKFYGDIYDGVKKIKTAYDVDAVCEEMNNIIGLSENCPYFCKNCMEKSCEDCMVEKCIKIARNGGKKK